MNTDIQELKDRLDKTGFVYSASAIEYNPMERFADYVSTKEIVHSRIIADLLNPKGEHQLGYGFLLQFLNELDIKPETVSGPEDSGQLKVEEIKTEFSAPTKESNGRIDIFMRLECLGRKYALIIENKLNDAPDQPRQLKRYNEYVAKKFPEYKRITIYMPRLGEVCEEYTPVVVINATKLAQIIEMALNENISQYKDTIKTYTAYLRNISKYNIIMDNAYRLASLDSHDIKKARAIKEAYDNLPEAFAKKIANEFDVKKEYTRQISSNYPNYCFIWDEDDYNKTRLWLAVGFTHDSCLFYVVSNDETKYAKYVEELNVSLSSKSYGHFWLKPNNESESICNFDGIPDWDNLKIKIIEWLSVLSKCADEVDK